MASFRELLRPEFYSQNTVEVAKRLLGTTLWVRNARRIWKAGMIVEDEAYLRDDPACHSYNGVTKRNQSMFKSPGTAYVYPIHQVRCFNVVTRPGEAVLIRAVEPVRNVTMATNGPGRLCRALEITRERHDGRIIGTTGLRITGNHRQDFEIAVSPRIGISKAKDLELRFYIPESDYLSRSAFSARKSAMR